MKPLHLLIYSLLLLASCSKEPDNTTPGNLSTPLVKTITADTTLVARYWYDIQGRLTNSWVYENPYIDSASYTYGNNTREKLFYVNGHLQEIEHGVTENGKLVSVSGLKADSTSYWKTFFYYDANGYLIREIHMDNDTVETWRTEYTIQDGNMTAMHRINFLPLDCSYEYYPNSVNSLSAMQPMDRLAAYQSVNLVKTITIKYAIMPAYTESYAYEFYNNGWVKKTVVTMGSGSHSLSYTYW
jgi:hypothetical protein